MEELTMNFDSLSESNAQPVEEPTGGKAEKRAKNAETIRKMTAMLEADKAKDPTLEQRIGIWSDKIRVEKTLGWTNSGNLVCREDVTDSRKLAPVSQIVGYRISNIGDEPIPYNADVWHRNQDGVFVSEVVAKVLNPGETADLSRKDMTVFCSKPEVSMMLENGKVVRGSAKVKGIEEELKAFYFSFSDHNTRVNSDEVKLQIGTRVEGANGQEIWQVKPEFEEAFGFLNNPVAGKRGRGSKGSGKNKTNMQVLAAAYVRSLLDKPMQ